MKYAPILCALVVFNVLTPQLRAEIEDQQRAPKGYPDLIIKIQTALKQAGLDAGEPDGDFGARSAEAVVEFQKRNVGAMYVDSVVGPQTGTAPLKNNESWPRL